MSALKNLVTMECMLHLEWGKTKKLWACASTRAKVIPHPKPRKGEIDRCAMQSVRCFRNDLPWGNKTWMLTTFSRQKKFLGWAKPRPTGMP